MPYTPITPEQFAATDGLDDWRVVLQTAEAHFRAPSFPAAGRLVAAIADAAEAADHHPDVSLAYPGIVRVELTTHAIDGLSTHDVDLARHISELAADAGATPEPGA
jgi:4a-hydroxytetrahydrobiopterin dehydratase